MFQRVTGENSGNYICDTQLALAAGDIITTTETVMAISQKQGDDS